MSRRITRLISANTRRKPAETAVPMVPPTALKPSKRERSASAEIAMPSVARITMVEWPSEKNRPTEKGRLPSCISLCVTVSIAAMWPASTAWRRPKS